MQQIRLELAYRGLTNVRTCPEQLKMDATCHLPSYDDAPDSSGDIPNFSAAWFIARLRRAPGLTPSRRRDLISSLQRVVKLSGLPAESVEFTPAALRLGFLSRSAREHGLATGTQRNILSGLRWSLRNADVIAPANTPLSNVWTMLLAKLDARQRAGLTALGGFCTLRHITPDDVNDAVFEAFEAQVETRTIVPKPRKYVAAVRHAWNRAARTVPGWPSRRLERRRTADQYVLPLAAFPVSFQADLAAFGERLGASVLDVPAGQALDNLTGGEAGSDAPRRQLRPSTVRTRFDHCRWAGSALVASGVPIEELTSLASLVTPIDRARQAGRFLHQRAGNKPSAAGGHVLEILRIIAKHWVHLPKAEVEQIRKWAKPVTLVYDRMTAKNEARIKEALVPARDEALLALPDVLMAVARSLLADSPRQAASVAMQAVAVGLLTRIPLRLANVVGLRLDEHLQREDPTQPAISHIMIPADEVKNKRPIVLPVAPKVNRLLQEWIVTYRPIDAAPGCHYLFPGHGTGDRPITPQALREAVVKATREHAGVRLSPHQFRHLAARKFLKAFPGQYEVVRQLLGHADLATTLRAYCSQEDEEAIRRYDEVVSQRLHARNEDRTGANDRAISSAGVSIGRRGRTSGRGR